MNPVHRDGTGYFLVPDLPAVKKALLSRHGTNNPLISDDQFHAYVMSLGGNRPVDQLEIMAQPYKMSLPAGMLQKSVIKTLAITDTMTGQIKGNTGNNDQVRLVGLMVTAGRAGLQNAKTPFGKIFYSLNLPEHHAVITNCRKQHPLTGCKRRS